MLLAILAMHWLLLTLTPAPAKGILRDPREATFTYIPLIMVNVVYVVELLIFKSIAYGLILTPTAWMTSFSAFFLDIVPVMSFFIDAYVTRILGFRFYFFRALSCVRLLRLLTSTKGLQVHIRLYVGSCIHLLFRRFSKV